MEDFESSPEFQALVVAATGKPERSMGDSVIPAEPPQWKEVHKLASGLLEQAPAQMPVLIHKIQSSIHLKGFAGLHSSLQELYSLLNEKWDTLYPQPDLEDPDDMYYARVNLMRELSDQPAFAEALYRRPLVSAKGIGEFSTRDIDICNGAVTGSDEEKARCQDGLIRGAFAECDRAALEAMSADLTRIIMLMSDIENVFDERAGEPGILSLKMLKERAELCNARFHEFAAEHLQSQPQPNEAIESDIATDGPASGPINAVPATKHSSSLQDTEAVVHSFNRILQFYQFNEPSSPVRLLAGRAREFVGLSFFDVLHFLAPQYKDNLPALLAELEKQPLAFLLGDTYNRFLSGDLEYHASSTSSSQDDSEAGVQDLLEHASGGEHNSTVPGSRDEVVTILQDIEAYYTVNEPSSPLPLILSDIRKLVNKRFTELVAEFRSSLPVEPSSEASD